MNTESDHYGMHLGQYQSDEMQPVPLQKETAVYEQLEGSEKFYQDITNYAYNHPDEVLNVSFIGGPGVGKETAAGHFLAKLENDVEFQNWLKSQGRQLDVQYVSFADVIKEARKMRMFEKHIGEISMEGLLSTSVLARDTLVALNERKPDPNAFRLVIFEAPGVSYTESRTTENTETEKRTIEKTEDVVLQPGKDSVISESVKGAEQKAVEEQKTEREKKDEKDKHRHLGDVALDYLFKKENHFCHALVEDEAVIEKSLAIRELLAREDVSEDEFKQLFEELGVEWKGFDISKRDAIRYSMGAPQQVEGFRKGINRAAVTVREKGGVFPEKYDKKPTVDALEQNPTFRAAFIGDYYNYWLVRRYRTREGRLFVAQNQEYSQDKVQFHREKIDSKRANISQALQAYGATYPHEIIFTPYKEE